MDRNAAGAVPIRGVNKSDALVHHPLEQRDRRALILNSLCFGGALPPFKLSYRLVIIASHVNAFSGGITANFGEDGPMTVLV